ncbi:MAG: hypothetical protein WC627_00210 [Legionella sp.]|jgi:hypothetical protein
MIFEHSLFFQRKARCQFGYTHKFDEKQQRTLFINGLAKGAALISPDELSYFRSGCELGSKEEQAIYDGLSGFAVSALLLTEHRLFGTYHGVSSITEASLQITVSTLYVVHELIQTLLSTIKLGISLAFTTLTLGLNTEVRNFAVENAQATLAHLVKACASTLLCLTGIIGALITRSISTAINPAVCKTDKTLEELSKEIGCENSDKIGQLTFWSKDPKKPNRGAASRLEQAIGSFGDVLEAAPALMRTPFTIECSHTYY